MKILCLTSRLPYPPNRGDRLRAFNFIKQLSHQHQLSLLSFVAHKAERDYVAALQEYCQDVRVVRMGRLQSTLSVLLNSWRSQPLQTLYYRSRAMHHLVRTTLSEKSFDAAYVHLFRMAPYVLDYSQLYRILDLTDVISSEVKRSIPYRGLVSRLLYTLEQPRIEKMERTLAELLEETWLISEADHQKLAQICPQANVRVVPNGVDLTQFYPTGENEEPNTLIFVGHLSVFHNVDAALQLAQNVLPRVQQQNPNCRLIIVGADPAPQVQRLAQLPSVVVTGFVPNLNSYLNRASIFVAPLRFAAGIQNKVLEAMAAGRPVVTTGVVNAGLGAVPGRDLIVADDVSSMTSQIIALLQDERQRFQIGQSGLNFVRQKYNWCRVVERMEAIETELTRRR